MTSDRSIDVRVSDRGSALSSSDWKSFTAHASVYYTPEWFAALAPEIDGPPLLFTASRSNGAVAVLPAFVTSRPWPKDLHHPRIVTVRPRHLQETLASKFPGVPQFAIRSAQRLLLRLIDRRLLPALVCTSPFGHTGEVLIPPDAADREAVIEALLHAAESYARNHQLRSVAFLWVPATQRPLLDVLRRRGYQLCVTNATHRLATHWDRFDDYLATFRHNRRGVIRHEMARFKERGGRIQEEPWPAIEDRAIALTRSLQGRYGQFMPSDRLAGRYRRLIDALGTAAVHYTARVDGNLAGFLTAFRHANVLYPKLGGFDYPPVHGLFAYFNLVFYHLTSVAIEQGIHEIHYGPASHLAKLGRGCEMIPVYAAFHVMSPAVDRMARWYLPRLHRDTVAEFKQLALRYGETPAPAKLWEAQI